MIIDKKRLLIPISFSFSIRYIVRTGMLKELRSFCEPVIALTWKEEDLINELRDEGYEVYLVPESSKTPVYASIRKKIDICFDYFLLKSNSKKLQSGYTDLFLPWKYKFIRDIRRWYNIISFFPSSSRKKLFEKEKDLLLTETNFAEIDGFIDALNINAVFTVTPFHQQEDILLRVCKEKGKKMITSILSFDNITKRGWIPVLYDVYMVWNKYNKNELKRAYPSVKDKSAIYITGAPQFDFYFDASWLLPKKEWMQLIGVKDENCKIILYAGGPVALFPNEPQYMLALAYALSNNKIKGNVKILFRCHPVDKIDRWKKALKDCTNIIFESSWTGNEKLVNANVTNKDVSKLCSTLAYSDVHINLCSTMTVDGSAFKKPQIAPYYDEVDKKNENLLRNFYKQEHFLPIIKTGGLALAESKDQLVELVNEALENPQHFTEKSEKIIGEIITYTDGYSTQRVTEVIRKTLIPKSTAVLLQD